MKDSDNEPIALIGVATDITEMKRAREELVLAKERAEKSDRLKSEFLTQMSHEIRSPMNVIENFSEILKETYVKNNCPDITSLIDGIELSSQRIIRTMELILNMSEMQIGSYEPTWQSLDLINDILLTLKTKFSLKAQDKGLQLNFINFPHEVRITGDRYSINQIFLNLLDNAIKYTEKGNIDVTISRSRPDKIEVSIIDTGIGIAEDYLDKLFEPFMQEEQGYSRKFDGNGLGLALVRKYCDLNGIQISVESKKGMGSRFILTFDRKS